MKIVIPPMGDVITLANACVMQGGKETYVTSAFLIQSVTKAHASYPGNAFVMKDGEVFFVTKH